MPFPIFNNTFNNLPPISLPKWHKLQELSDWETSDDGNKCISFWQYAHIILELKNHASFNSLTKAALKELYFTNTPMRTCEIGTILHKNWKAIQGPHGLGGYGVAFHDSLKRNWPRFTFPTPPTKIKNAYYQIYIDLISYDKPYDKIFLILKSRFRAALCQCFGDTVIRRW